jgi:hypothetical protein
MLRSAKASQLGVGGEHRYYFRYDYNTVIQQLQAQIGAHARLQPYLAAIVEPAAEQFSSAGGQLMFASKHKHQLL